MRRTCFSAFIVLITFTALASQAAAEAQWIWSPRTKDDASGKPAFFRKTFTLGEPDKTKGASRVEITADNTYILLVNGARVGAGNNWNEGTIYDISPLLEKGSNTIAVECMSPDEFAGLAARIYIKTKDGKTHTFHTDKTWKATLTPKRNWEKPKFDDADWEPAHVFGELNKVAPWNANVKFTDKPAKGDWAPQITPTIEATYLPQKAHGPWELELKDNDRVVLLGNTFVEREVQHGYIELALTARYPEKNITFRNLGWSGDTVWGESRARFGGQREGFEHLVKWVRACNPTVILIAYGQNEAFEGKAGVERFVDGLNKLVKAIEDTGARIAFIGPYKMEDLGPPLPSAQKKNEKLEVYSGLIKKFAGERGLPFIDLFHMRPCFTCVYTQKNPANPDDRTLAYHKFPITSNNLHLTELGYWHVANQIVAQLEPKPKAWFVSLKMGGGAEIASMTTLKDLKTVDGRVSFTAVDPTLPAPTLHIDMPGDKAIRLTGEELQYPARVLRVKGLPESTYELRIDGKAYAKATHQQLADPGIAITESPAHDQADKLREAILKKNELFFHHYRPANETYLFLFRKHEQGNNAVEIPQFIPLIEEVESKIAELRKPKPQTYELAPVKE